MQFHPLLRDDLQFMVGLLRASLNLLQKVMIEFLGRRCQSDLNHYLFVAKQSYPLPEQFGKGFFFEKLLYFFSGLSNKRLCNSLIHTKTKTFAASFELVRKPPSRLL